MFSICACISGFAYAFFYGWEFGCACIAFIPMLLFVLVFFGMKVKKTTAERLEVIKELGGVVEETLTAIKVVTSFGREDREMAKFIGVSEKTKEIAMNQMSTYAVMVALMKFTTFMFYAYAFYVGSWFIQLQIPNNSIGSKSGVYDYVTVVQTVIAIITGFICMVGALPNVQAIMQAKTLGVQIFSVIEREPVVRNVASPSKQFTLEDAITFQNVTFKYPTAPEEHKPTLIDASFKIKAGQATAIVGPSGSGKSTIIQLVERFYDPQLGGKILFDDQDIKQIDLKCLRERIGYVSQEPALILGTIRDNLLFGNKDAT
jgi:ABC-type multidrug transport system fused ATPase/permease subunit